MSEIKTDAIETGTSPTPSTELRTDTIPTAVPAPRTAEDPGNPPTHVLPLSELPKPRGPLSNAAHVTANAAIVAAEKVSGTIVDNAHRVAAKVGDLLLGGQAEEDDKLFSRQILTSRRVGAIVLASCLAVSIGEGKNVASKLEEDYHLLFPDRHMASTLYPDGPGSSTTSSGATETSSTASTPATTEAPTTNPSSPTSQATQKPAGAQIAPTPRVVTTPQTTTTSPTTAATSTEISTTVTPTPESTPKIVPTTNHFDNDGGDTKTTTNTTSATKTKPKSDTGDGGGSSQNGDTSNSGGSSTGTLPDLNN
jgi:hypothetical protein